MVKGVPVIPQVALINPIMGVSIRAIRDTRPSC